jgi:phenylpyruvate tautomerase PptA (4-oxalocrotonate tautomerase family)
MPLLKLQLSIEIKDDLKKKVLHDLSKKIAETFSKPENYVMVVIEQGFFQMSGTEGNAAFGDFRGIGGINSKTTVKFSQVLCDYLMETLSIPKNRVYINFTDIDAANWGWNGSTF